jgi:hypothetical protein
MRNNQVATTAQAPNQEKVGSRVHIRHCHFNRINGWLKRRIIMVSVYKENTDNITDVFTADES